MLTIRTQGNRALLEGEIPSQLERALQERYCWVNPENVTDIVYFYADRVMYSGVALSMAEFLQYRGFEVAVVFPELPEPDFDADITRAPRPMHQDVVDAILDKRYGYVKAPPGVGKTAILSHATCELGLSPTFIVVPNERPFAQAFTTFTEHTTVQNIGRWGDGFKEPGDVNITMIQTLAAELDKNPDGELARLWRSAKVVFVDEQHHGGADSYVSVFEQLPNVKVLVGLSATPKRPDDRQDWLEAILGQEIAGITRAQALEHKLNVPLTVFVEDIGKKEYGYIVDGRNISSSTKRKGQKTPYEKVYDDYVIYNEERNRKALQFCYEALDQGMSVCISVSRIEHIEELQRLDPRIVALHGKTKNRQEIFDKMTSKEIKFVASTLMDEAVDVPSLSCVVMLAGGKSPVKLEQRIRCDRTFVGETVDGFFEKDRGYVWFPRDTADFLTSHANANIKLLKQICDEHHLHEFFINDQRIPKGRGVPPRR